MARSIVPITVVDAAGNAVANATVNVKVRSTGSNAVLYTTEAGATTASNPITTDAGGRVQAWVDRGQYNAVVSGSGFTTYTQPFESDQPTTDIVTSLPANAIPGQVVFYSNQNYGYNMLYTGAGNWTYAGGNVYSLPFSAPDNSIFSTTGVKSLGTATFTTPYTGQYTLRISTPAMFSSGGSTAAALLGFTYATNYAAMTSYYVTTTPYFQMSQCGYVTDFGLTAGQVVRPAVQVTSASNSMGMSYGALEIVPRFMTP